MTSLTDPQRLRLLRATGLLDRRGDESFARLTRLAARVLGAVTATLTLVDEDRDVCLSSAGGPERGIPPRSMSLEVLERGTTLNAPRALAVPVRHPDGPVMGVLYATRIASRTWSLDSVAVLEDIAAMATTQLELRLAIREASARVRAGRHRGDGAERSDRRVQSRRGAALRLRA